MPDRLDPGQPIDTGVRLLIMVAIDHAIVHVDDARAADQRAVQSDVEHHVHEARKRCKEARAYIRLLDAAERGTPKRLDHRLRDAGRALAPVRDAHVAADLAARVLEDCGGAVDTPTLDDRELRPSDVEAALDGARDELESARALVGRLDLRHRTRALRAGVEMTYREARRAYRRARRSPSTANLHRWRSRSKRVWYQLRVLDPDDDASATTAAFDELGETLGDHHDLAVHLDGLDGVDPEVCPGLAEQRARQEALREQALEQGRELFSVEPKRFARARIDGWRSTPPTG